MNSPELSNLRIEAQKQLADSVSSYWISAFANGAYDNMREPDSSTRCYRFNVCNDEDLRRYCIDVYFHEENTTLIPDLFTVRKRQFIDEVCEIEEIHVDLSCQKFLRRHGIMTYDYINQSGKRLESIIDEDLEWETKEIYPLERFNEELRSTDLEKTSL